MVHNQKRNDGRKSGHIMAKPVGCCIYRGCGQCDVGHQGLAMRRQCSECDSDRVSCEAADAHTLAFSANVHNVLILLPLFKEVIRKR